MAANTEEIITVINFQNANLNGSAPTTAADSKQKQKVKTYEVCVLVPYLNEQPTIRTLKVKARRREDARAVASELIGALTTEQLVAASFEWNCLEEPEILHVYPSRFPSDVPGHSWTRQEIESEHLDELVKEAESQLQ